MQALRLALALLLSVPAVAAPRRVVLLPIQAIGADAARGPRIAGAVREALAGRADVALGAPPPGTPGDCAASESCTAEAGRAAGADVVLAVGVAGLGDTHVLRVRLLDGRTAVVRQELRESAVGDERLLLARVTAMVRQLFPAPPAPPPRRSSWWLVAGAVALVGAAVAVPLLLPEDERLSFP